MKMHLASTPPKGIPRATVLSHPDSAAQLGWPDASLQALRAFWDRGGKGWFAAPSAQGDAYVQWIEADASTPAGAEKHRQAGAALAKLLNASKFAEVALAHPSHPLVEGLCLAN
jgi:hypothetical protein